ncbi:MAG: anhydro-N-acetylmuramic acid kinase [Pseudomonadota bacterium]
MGDLLTAIGLMSGTSMDGIDVAMLHTDGKSQVQRGPSSFFPYKADFRKQLHHVLEDAKAIEVREDRPGSLPRVEKQLTDLHIQAVKAFLEENALAAEAVDLLGFHGQTVLHRPEEKLTVQIGDGNALAKEIGINTVFDMRAADVTNGGQGAPLVPFYHQALAANLPNEFFGVSPVCFVNIGGISNITYVGEQLIAFDTGPGNALIDQWVQQHAGVPYDQGGMIAAEGRIDQKLANGLLDHSYFSQPLPKSLDRLDFSVPEPDWTNLENGARTLCYVTAASIIRAAEHLPDAPKLWIITGGGRKNPHIMADIKAIAEKSDGNVITSEEAGFDGDMMEAEAWAYLAVRSINGLPLTAPGTTGCINETCGGILTKY